jgi:TonB-linked SusC/RagA family outer membrane protein
MNKVSVLMAIQGEMVIKRRGMSRGGIWVTASLLMASLFVPSFVSVAHGQEEWKVSGTVTDAEDGLPLPSVTVSIQGVARGTVSDVDGKFSLQVPKGKSIVFSYIGYKTQTVPVKNGQALSIKLEQDALMLEEVVAVGYGSLKKSDLTGAIASIKADQLQKTPSSGMDQALQGRVAGVTVNANSGRPGQAAEVRIRGIGTIGNSAPIYVVDGVITDDISFLSPNDITSTEILKDASSTAIFGSRGANGVVLITTLKGAQGKANISYNTYLGVQNIGKRLSLMNGQEFARTLLKLRSTKSAANVDLFEFGFNDWLSDDLGSSPYFPVVKTAGMTEGLDYKGIETDWQDEVFVKNAAIQNHHLSITGGNDKDNYAFSVGYFDQTGTIMGSSYNRLTLRLNSSHKVREWLKFGENLSFINSASRNGMTENSESPGASLLSAAIAMAPWDPTHYPAWSYNANGEDLSGQISAASNFKNVINPFSMVEHYHPKETVERWFGDVYAELTPIKNLTLRSSISLDLSNNQNKNFVDAYRHSGHDAQERNFLTVTLQRHKSLTFENIATYLLDVGKHSFSLMAGQTSFEYNYYAMDGSGYSILNPISSNWYLDNTTEDKAAAHDVVSRSRMLSFLGRLHYTYDNRYMATLNFRADGSNKFPENPWGYFPSLALAWRVSEEGWYKEAAFFDAFEYLKLRLGWGQIGNEKVENNAFSAVIKEYSDMFVVYPFGVTPQLYPGVTVLTQVNRGGRWEFTEQWNGGIDFGILKGLLSVTLDGFIRDTHDMLLPVKAPAPVGNRFDATKNAASVRNEGIEISLDHQNRFHGIDYSLSGNVSFIRNELTALNGGNPVYDSQNHYSRLNNEGLPLWTFWGYEYQGIYRSDEEAVNYLPNTNAFHAGDARYTDFNGDGKIDDSDKTNLGNPFPWLTYGLNASASYRGFDLQLFFQGVYGNKIYNAMRHRTEGAGNEATLSTTMRDVWVDITPTLAANMENYGIDPNDWRNTNGTIPNPNGSSMNNDKEVLTSRFIEDGAYFRLKNVQLGYTLPKSLTRKLDIGRCRFYVSASNVFTLTGYTGYDPEVGNGVDYGNYPQARTVLVGLNLDF